MPDCAVVNGATGNRTPIPWMQTTCSPVKLWPQARLQISDFRFQIEPPWAGRADVRRDRLATR